MTDSLEIFSLSDILEIFPHDITIELSTWMVNEISLFQVVSGTNRAFMLDKSFSNVYTAFIQHSSHSWKPDIVLTDGFFLDELEGMDVYHHVIFANTVVLRVHARFCWYWYGTGVPKEIRPEACSRLFHRR